MPDWQHLLSITTEGKLQKGKTPNLFVDVEVAHGVGVLGLHVDVDEVLVDRQPSFVGIGKSGVQGGSGPLHRGSLGVPGAVLMTKHPNVSLLFDYYQTFFVCS